MKELSRREANKRDKLERIRAAARTVFTEKGFVNATLREISSEAGVAFGTLYLYVKDKEDLLLLLFEEDLPILTLRAVDRAAKVEGFVERLIAFFNEFYDFFGENPELSRDMMREITFSKGIVGQRILLGVLDTERQIARIAAEMQAKGVVSPDISPSAAAHVIFSLYRVEIRFWLSGARKSREDSIAMLRTNFEVVFRGLGVK